MTMPKCHECAGQMPDDHAVFCSIGRIAELQDENARMKRVIDRLRGALEELNMNTNNVLAGGLGWFTRRDIAAAVADRSKAALDYAASLMPGEAKEGT